MQRPKCGFNVPEKNIGKSVYCADCSKRDRECLEYLRNKQRPLCAHCGQAKELKWQDKAGEWICNDCMAKMLEKHLNPKYVSMCPTCKKEFEINAQRPKMEGVMYCSLDCLPLEDGQEEHSGRDPKSRYYDQGGLEVLDVIRAKLTPEQWRGYLLGNLIKYSCRANWKGDFERDAEKMKFYSGYLAEGSDV